MYISRQKKLFKDSPVKKHSLVLACLFILSSTMILSHEPKYLRPIKFAAGATFIKLPVPLERYEIDFLSLEADKDQVITIYLDSPFKDLQLEFTTWGERRIIKRFSNYPFYRGRLPSKGKYVVKLKSTGKAQEARLFVAINPRGEEHQLWSVSSPDASFAFGYNDLFYLEEEPSGETPVPPYRYSLRYVNTEDYQKTNLKDACFSIMQIDPEKPEEKAPGTGFEPLETKTENLGGKTLSFSLTEEGAAGTKYEIYTWSYQTEKMPVKFQLILATSNLGNYPPGKYVEFDRDSLLAECRKIIQNWGKTGAKLAKLGDVINSVPL